MKKNVNVSVSQELNACTNAHAQMNDLVVDNNGKVHVQRIYTGGEKTRRMNKLSMHQANRLAKLLALGLTPAEAMADLNDDEMAA